MLKPPRLQLFTQSRAFLRNQVTPTPICVPHIVSLRRSQAYPNKSSPSQKYPANSGKTASEIQTCFFFFSHLIQIWYQRQKGILLSWSFSCSYLHFVLLLTANQFKQKQILLQPQMWTACVCFFFIWKIADSYNPRQKNPFLQRSKKVQKHKREKSWGIQEEKKGLQGIIVLFAKQNCRFCKWLFNCWYEFSMVIKFFPGSDRRSLVGRNKSGEFELCAIGSLICSNFSISWSSLYFLIYFCIWKHNLKSIKTD